jgi:ABC-2 type transport system ATP-binding protein
MQAAIEVNTLTKHYFHQNGSAIEGLSFSIHKGELFGLVGPDGAGKTTTMRILSTVLPPSSGSAAIFGFDVKTKAENARAKIGYMPQNFSLYPDLTVIENLNFFADINHVSRELKQERIKEMLTFTRLEGFQNLRSNNLSGGMKKKLALACSLIHEPQVLLLDEPSTGVDPVSRRELWVILAKVVQQGVTVLITTPYMDEAERCNRVGIIHQGQLLTTGSPAELESSVPFEVIEVKAKPRKTIREVVQDSKDILDWRPVGDRLRLSVTNSQSSLRSLKRKVSETGLEVKVLRPARVSMEDVFVYYMGRNGKVKDD